jgi:hypothetical protein
MSVNLNEFVVWVIAFGVPALLVVLNALAKPLVDWIQAKTPFGMLVTEEAARKILQEAINYGIGYATQKVKENNLEVKFDNAFIGVVLQYVVERTPDALEQFGITPTALEAMVKARLGLLAPEVAMLPVKGP